RMTTTFGLGAAAAGAPAAASTARARTSCRVIAAAPLRSARSRPAVTFRVTSPSPCILAPARAAVKEEAPKTRSPAALRPVPRRAAALRCRRCFDPTDAPPPGRWSEADLAAVRICPATAQSLARRRLHRDGLGQWACLHFLRQPPPSRLPLLCFRQRVPR